MLVDAHISSLGYLWFAGCLACLKTCLWGVNHGLTHEIFPRVKTASTSLYSPCAHYPIMHLAPSKKKQIAKTLAGIVFNFPETTNEKLQVMQYFGRQTRCIMRDVQLPSSKAILGFLNWSLCYGYSWKFCKIFWLWVFSLFKTLPGCRAYNHGVF